MKLICFLSIETPAPFAVNGNTTELVVTAPLDREESEKYKILVVCTVQTETAITKVHASLEVLVDDEDDNAPYVNGTDTTDVVISYNRKKAKMAAPFSPRLIVGPKLISRLSHFRAQLSAPCLCLTEI